MAQYKSAVITKKGVALMGKIMSGRFLSYRVQRVFA